MCHNPQCEESVREGMNPTNVPISMVDLNLEALHGALDHNSGKSWTGASDQEDFSDQESIESLSMDSPDEVEASVR